MVPNDNVLVGFSGSSSSLALLQMLTMGKKEPDPKKLTYKIMFAFIDGKIIIIVRREVCIYFYSFAV